MTVEVRVQVWDMDEVERCALELERAAVGAEPSLRKLALEIAQSFEHAGRALEFVDDDDADVIFDLLTRLDSLRAEAESLISAITTSPSSAGEDEITRMWSRPVEAAAIRAFADDDVTAIRARSVRLHPRWGRISAPSAASNGRAR